MRGAGHSRNRLRARPAAFAAHRRQSSAEVRQSCCPPAGKLLVTTMASSWRKNQLARFALNTGKICDPEHARDAKIRRPPNVLGRFAHGFVLSCGANGAGA